MMFKPAPDLTRQFLSCGTKAKFRAKISYVESLFYITYTTKLFKPFNIVLVQISVITPLIHSAGYVYFRFFFPPGCIGCRCMGNDKHHANILGTPKWKPPLQNGYKYNTLEAHTEIIYYKL